MKRIRCCHVHVPIQNISKIQPETGEIEETTTFLKFNQEVYVTRIGRITASYRAEHAGAHDPTTPHQIGYDYANIIYY